MKFCFGQAQAPDRLGFRYAQPALTFIVDLRINETLQTGVVRIPHLPFSRLVGTVSNSADAVRLETAPTGGESDHLFLEFTIGGCRDVNLDLQAKEPMN